MCPEVEKNHIVNFIKTKMISPAAEAHFEMFARLEAKRKQVEDLKKQNDELKRTYISKQSTFRKLLKGQEVQTKEDAFT